MLKMLPLLATAFFLCYANGKILQQFSMTESVDELLSEVNKDPDLEKPEALGFNITNPPQFELHDGTITSGRFYQINESSLIIYDTGNVRLDVYIGNQKVTANFTHVKFSSPAYSGPAVITSTNTSFHVGIDAKYDSDTAECDAKVSDLSIVAIPNVKFVTAELSQKSATEDEIKHVITAVNKEMNQSDQKKDIQKEFKDSFCREVKEQFSSNRLRRFARPTSWLSSALKSFAHKDLIESP